MKNNNVRRKTVEQTTGIMSHNGGIMSTIILQFL